MLIFREAYSYFDPFNVIFLCGSKYDKKNPRDKRVILKNYIKNNITNCQVVILEEHFSFSSRPKSKTLKYDSVFLTNLADVEKIASLYSDRVIIIHETISTAAELGMLAGESELKSKIFLLVPNDISIEERKMTSFINLAFFRGKKDNVVQYYPDVEVFRYSKYKSDYYTFFHNDTIGDCLGSEILRCIKKNNQEHKILFSKKDAEGKCLQYSINKSKTEINVKITADILKIQLLSMFQVQECCKEFRTRKKLTEHVSYIVEEYKKIIINTICDIEGVDSESYSITITIENNEIYAIRKVVGYFLYLLQAIDFIRLETNDQFTYKIVIEKNLKNSLSHLEQYISEKKMTAFGGLIDGL